MAAYTGGLPPYDPTIGDPASNYVALAAGDAQLLDFGGALGTFDPVVGNTATNYRLAFSTEPPTPRPSIGQIWPRGAGQA